MSILKPAFLFGAVLALIPIDAAWAHGTEQHGAGTAAEDAGSAREADAEIVVTIDPDAAAQVFQVPRGAHVHLTVHGAGASELHLHGYDIAVTGVPGQPAIFVFDADHAGRFALEMHIEDDLLGRGEKAVLYLEVRAP